MKLERRETYYSIGIIIVIPLLFLSNTLLIANTVKQNTIRNMSRYADNANTVLAEALRGDIEKKDYTAADNTLNKIVRQQASIANTYITIRDNNSYKIIAKSTDAPQNLSQTDTLQLSIVFDRARSTAKRIDAITSDGKSAKGWNVITPLFGDDGKVEAALSSVVLTTDAESLVNSSLKTSLLVSSITMLLIIGLLIHHLRFVGYADLLRRQKEVNQTMSDFLSVATHELKAPMTIIKGYLSNVLDGDYGEVNDEVKKQISTAISQTERLNSLVQDLLNVSRIDQGRITFELTSADPQPIIETLVKSYLPHAAEKQLELTYNPANKALITTDIGRFQEIMTNLIDNAIKYTPSGSVTITHRLTKSMLVTSVRDTGPGMTDEERARLFQRFYRVKNDYTADIAGTGLGLWIIKQYVEKMGGVIHVSSIVGAGSEFVVELPLAKNAPLPPPASS